MICIIRHKIRQHQLVSRYSFPYNLIQNSLNQHSLNNNHYKMSRQDFVRRKSYYSCSGRYKIRTNRYKKNLHRYTEKNNVQYKRTDKNKIYIFRHKNLRHLDKDSYRSRYMLNRKELRYNLHTTGFSDAFRRIRTSLSITRRTGTASVFTITRSSGCIRNLR